MRQGQGTRGASLTSTRVTPRRRTGLLLSIAAVWLTLDILTKVLVVAELEGQRQIKIGQLLLRASRNPGAAFSFAENSTLVFTIFAVVVTVGVLYVSRRVRDGGWALALGLLLGGATGNLVDRLFRSPGIGRGAVVDFIDFQVYPSFNLADSGIVIGGLLALYLSFRGRELNGSRTSKD